jgi:hypothetical protein
MTIDPEPGLRMLCRSVRLGIFRCGLACASAGPSAGGGEPARGAGQVVGRGGNIGCAVAGGKIADLLTHKHGIIPLLPRQTQPAVACMSLERPIDKS